MAPKKAAVPKKTVDEVNAEYSEKQEAAQQRIAVLKRQLTEARQQCDQSRLDMVAMRENRVYYDARVAAEMTSNEQFEQQAVEHLEGLKTALQQAKRYSKDKGYEIAYVREIVAGVEKEIAAVQQAMHQLEIDSKTDPKQLERELDRLAKVAAAVEGERPKLQRTVASLRAHTDRVECIAPVARTPLAAEAPLQLTIVGGSCVGAAHTEDSAQYCFSSLHLRSILSPTQTLQQIGSALTQVCGFRVVDRLVPDCSIVTQQLLGPQRSEHGYYARVESALQAASSGVGTSLQEDDAVISMVIIHCPCRLRRVATCGASTANPQREYVLLLSRTSDAAKELMRFTEYGRILDADFVDLVEVPLSTVVSLCISTSRRRRVTLVIDTWPAPLVPDDVPGGASHPANPDDNVGDRGTPSSAFCLYWSKEAMQVPLVYEYAHPLSSSVVSQRHENATCLSPVQVLGARGLMLEALTAVVQCTTSLQLLDSVTVGKSMEWMLAQRFAASLRKVENGTGTPFSNIMVDAEIMRQCFHVVPVSRQPIPSPHPLHFEGRPKSRVTPAAASTRDDTGTSDDHWAQGGKPLALQSKWRLGCAAAAAAAVAMESQDTVDPTAHPQVSALQERDMDLLRFHQEQESKAPHVRFVIDAAVEDAEYLTAEEDVEDFDLATALEAAGADESQQDASRISNIEATEGNQSSRHPATKVRFNRRRQKPIRSDEEEWGQLVARRIRQAIIAEDEHQRRLREAPSAVLHPASRSVIPPPMIGTLALTPKVSLKQRGSTASMSEAVSIPQQFSVTANPLSHRDAPILLETLAPDEWFIEGKRCPERTVMVEMLATLDVKRNENFGVSLPNEGGSAKPHSFSNVTQAKDALSHSVKRRIELLCEALDVDRPQGLLIQVAYRVQVMRLGGLGDSSHFRAQVVTASILSEESIRLHGIDSASRRAKKWIRGALTAALRRWDARNGHEWIPCAEVTLATSSASPSEFVFRCTRLFYVLRNWECGLRLETKDPFLSSFQRRVAWLEHLLRSILRSGGLLGSATSSGTGPCVRLIDAKEIPQWVGVSRAALTPGIPTASQGNFLGPQSHLHLMCEAEIRVALELVLGLKTAHESSTLSGALHGRSTPPPHGGKMGCVLLCWAYPASVSRSLQPASHQLVSPTSSLTGGDVVTVMQTIRSLANQLHGQVRAHPSGVLYRVVCTTMEYEDNAVLFAPRRSGGATAAVTATHHQEALRRCGLLSPSLESNLVEKEHDHDAPMLHPLPLEELGVNKDEDTEAAAAQQTVTPRDAQHEGKHYAEHVAEVQHAAAAAPPSGGPGGEGEDAEDDPGEYDESFRPLHGACLHRRPKVLSDARRALLPLTERLLENVFVAANAPLADGTPRPPGARVVLSALTWHPEADAPRVAVMINGSRAAATPSGAGAGNAKSRVIDGTVSDDDETALSSVQRARGAAQLSAVEAFLGSVIAAAASTDDDKSIRREGRIAHSPLRPPLGSNSP